jgi:hypothetical protein
MHKDVFENKRPAETRKYVLGPQLTTMTFWPGKMSSSPRPEVQALGMQAKQVTDTAIALVNDIGAAETVLAQFATGPWAAFLATCNATVKRLFGQLSEIEHTPPPGQKGSLPAGFVDRFFVRDTSGRMMTIKEQQEAVDRTRAKLVAQEAQLKVQKDKQAKELNDKLLRELKKTEDQASDAQRVLDDAAAERARIQAEIEKNKTPPDDAR